MTRIEAGVHGLSLEPLSALQLCLLGACVHVHGVKGRGVEPYTMIAVFWVLVASMMMICWLCLGGGCMCGFFGDPLTQEPLHYTESQSEACPLWLSL